MRWLWPLLLAPVLAFGQGAVVKTDEVRAELVAEAPEGVGARQAALARPADPPRAALAHLLEEPRRLRASDDARVDLAGRRPGRRRSSGRCRSGCRSARCQLRLRRHGAAAGDGYGAAPDFRGAALDVRLKADWLVCKEVCIPQSGSSALPSRPDRAPPRMPTRSRRRVLRCRRRHRPRPCRRRSTARSSRCRSMACLPTCAARRSTTFAADAGVIDHAGRVEQHWQRRPARAARSAVRAAQRESGRGCRRCSRCRASRAASSRVRGAGLATDSRRAQRGAASGAAPPPGLHRARHRGRPAAESGPAVAVARVRLLGGLLLNLMPCVFPVLVAEGASASRCRRRPAQASPAGPRLHGRRRAVVRRAGGAAAGAARRRRPARLGLPAAVAGLRRRPVDPVRADRPEPARRVRGRELLPSGLASLRGAIRSSTRADRGARGGGRVALHGAFHGRGARGSR